MQLLLNYTLKGDKLDKMRDGRNFPWPRELLILILSISIFSTHLKKEEVSYGRRGTSLEARPMHRSCYELRGTIEIQTAHRDVEVSQGDAGKIYREKRKMSVMGKVRSTYCPHTRPMESSIRHC